MADSAGLTIPQFREKTIYYTYEDKDFSYPVSASYRGILRLSPNDDGSLAEQNTVSMLDSIDQTVTIYYQDSIGTALVNQFIKVTTSDGYFVDFRLGEHNVEFNNLYVRGPAEFEQVRIINSRDESLFLDKVTILPGTANGQSKATMGGINGLATDVVNVDVHDDQLDSTYVLTSQSLDKRKFSYQQITPLVKKLILEALLDLKTVPTGSIHFTPINLEQYKALISKGIPNKYYNNEGREHGDMNDPIVRDYLICDGSEYYTKDFPELAKILEGEHITYWEENALSLTDKRMVMCEADNIHQDSQNEEKTFRVPDLRRMFIKSVWLGKDKAGQANNLTGKWMIDSRPMLENGKESDNHRHHITTAFYQKGPKNKKKNNNAEDYYDDWFTEDDVKITNFNKAAFPTGENSQYYKYTIEKNDSDGEPADASPSVLAPQNGQREWKRAGYGKWYRPQIFSWGCRIAYHVNANTCGYFLSHPQEYDFTKPGNFEPNVGNSSEEIISCVTEPKTDKNISYNDHQEYVPYIDGDDAGEEAYGWENAPEFYCMLPLIKI